MREREREIFDSSARLRNALYVSSYMYDATRNEIEKNIIGYTIDLKRFDVFVRFQIVLRIVEETLTLGREKQFAKSNGREDTMDGGGGGREGS